MCLTTNDPTIKVAEQDITVYKLLSVHNKRETGRNWFQILFGLNRYRKVFSATVNNFEYKIGEVNKTEELRVHPMHAGLNEVNCGYHSDAVPNGHSNAVFVIPKGTKYIAGWYNTTRDRANYVSETIIFKEVLKKD